MKFRLLLILNLIALLGIYACTRVRFDKVHIHGKVINGTLNAPMPGEQVSLYEVKGEFLGPGNGAVIKTVTTNGNGEYDFGGVDLRKKDHFSYYIQYVHRGITSDGFCDYYEVDKNALDQNKNLVVFVGAGVYFQITPDMSVLGANDSININVSTSANFATFYCNPNAVADNANKTHIALTKESFSAQGRSNPLDGGDAYYYFKIRKVKSGVVTTAYDTLLIRQTSLQYTINW
jgi:hypothetical protein